MPTQVYGLVDKSAGTGMHLPVKLYGSSAEAARAAKERLDAELTQLYEQFAATLAVPQALQRDLYAHDWRKLLEEACREAGKRRPPIELVVDQDGDVTHVHVFPTFAAGPAIFNERDAVRTALRRILDEQNSKRPLRGVPTLTPSPIHKDSYDARYFEMCRVFQ